MKTTPIVPTRNQLNEASEKPSTSSLVKIGMDRPTNVVRTLPIKPNVNAIFGRFVDRIKE
ncbi:lysophospholipase [Oceanobacillus picturae]|uniref:Lysophospholipase n=1 Tax=Oceanobacillus picturae TaxID=171693 RepID=A0A0U9HBP8_9BACI|nr:lysophospholipase [Oceanobacillus picturae]